MGGGDASGQVRGAGAGGGKAHPHLAGGPGIAVRRVGGALLMSGQDVVNLVPVAVQLVVHIQDRAAGVAEHGVDPLLQQALHDRLGCADFHSVSFFLPFGR